MKAFTANPDLNDLNELNVEKKNMIWKENQEVKGKNVEEQFRSWHYLTLVRQ